VVTIDSAFRNASGVYTCLITNTLNNNTINATATVVVECKLIKYTKVTVFLFLLKIRPSNYSTPFTNFLGGGGE
jgi:hypothetical protein